jgi:hypothetical protein
MACSRRRIDAARPHDRTCPRGCVGPSWSAAHANLADCRGWIAGCCGQVAEWQTRTVQVRVSVRTWGFNSPLAHRCRLHFRGWALVIRTYRPPDAYLTPRGHSETSVRLILTNDCAWCGRHQSKSLSISRPRYSSSDAPETFQGGSSSGTTTLDCLPPNVRWDSPVVAAQVRTVPARWACRRPDACLRGVIRRSSCLGSPARSRSPPCHRRR